MSPNNKEQSEATAMWHELEARRTPFEEMNELHQLQIGRIEQAHNSILQDYRDRIIYLGIVNDEVTEANAALRNRVNGLYLALFACALAIAYLVVNG